MTISVLKVRNTVSDIVTDTKKDHNKFITYVRPNKHYRKHYNGRYNSMGDYNKLLKLQQML